MNTTFVAREYVQALQALMDRQEVDITVKGFEPNRDLSTLGARPAAILQIDSFDVVPSNMPRTIDGTLTATLLVMVRLDSDKAEEAAFELAADVATSLVDEAPEGIPTIKGGPIVVRSIQPEVLDGAAEARIACFAVEYEQEISISRVNQPVEYPITTFFLGKEPLVGPAHVDDYEQLVPVEGE